MKNQKGNLLIIVAFLVVILLLAAVLMFKAFRREGQETQVGSKVDPQVQELNKQSDSDEAAAVEKDLNETNVDNLDNELSTAEETIERL